MRAIAFSVTLSLFLFSQTIYADTEKASKENDKCEEISRIYSNRIDRQLHDHTTEALRVRQIAEERQPSESTTYYLGLMYKHGEGVPQNYTEAAKWFCRAIERQMAYPLGDLGELYQNGDGVATDRVVAHALFSMHMEHFDKVDIPELQRRRNEVAESLERMSAEMTEAQIDRAQTLKKEMARPWNFSRALRHYLQNS